MGLISVPDGLAGLPYQDMIATKSGLLATVILMQIRDIW